MSKPRVLVIEDERKVAEAIRGALEQNGYEARTAQSGEDGLLLIESERFDVVVLDLQLPGRDGMEVLKTIRGRGRQIPVVILTTSAAEEDIIRAYEFSANCYITKPVDLEQFIKVVKSIEEFWLTVVKLPDK